jgi:hypothetical protein
MFYHSSSYEVYFVLSLQITVIAQMLHSNVQRTYNTIVFIARVTEEMEQAREVNIRDCSEERLDRHGRDIRR